jgi:hypothetical protein
MKKNQSFKIWLMSLFITALIPINVYAFHVDGKYTQGFNRRCNEHVNAGKLEVIGMESKSVKFIDTRWRVDVVISAWAMLGIWNDCSHSRSWYYKPEEFWQGSLKWTSQMNEEEKPITNKDSGCELYKTVVTFYIDVSDKWSPEKISIPNKYWLLESKDFTKDFKNEIKATHGNKDQTFSFTMYRLVPNLDLMRKAIVPINNQVKTLIVEVKDRNSRAGLSSEVTVRTKSKSHKEVLAEALGTNHSSTISEALNHLNKYVVKSSTQTGAKVSFNILSPSKIKIEVVNKEYYYAEKIMEMTDDEKQICLMTEIGDKVRQEKSGEGNQSIFVQDW